MTPEQSREIVVAELLRVAPDAEMDGLAPDTDLRSALELDSLDFQNLVANLSRRTGLRIEEEDYEQMSTLDRCISFLVGRSQQGHS
ncbi:acyl carrier protein [Kutzneria viridogrisea]